MIIPAVIAETQEELDSGVRKVEDFVGLIQLDVMDGRFVPNRSIDFDFALPKTRCRFEAHLMIEEPEEWIEKHGGKVDTWLVQVESCPAPERVMSLARTMGKKVGLALNPETPVAAVEKYLNRMDQVLIMTVHPGSYGSAFLPGMLAKISELRRRSPLLNIEVDGGVTPETIGLLDRAGANRFVSGSYIMRASDVKEAIMNLKKAIGG